MATKTYIIDGISYWASVIQPNTRFDNGTGGTWTIDVCQLDEDTKDLLQSLELPVKNRNDERGDFISIKQPVRNRKTGQPFTPPTVIDGNLNPITDKLIGNGSKVKVKFRPYPWNFNGRSGISAGLISVQVIDLVEYDSEGAEFTVVGEPSNDADDIPFASV
jgi:hypothetical protein